MLESARLEKTAVRLSRVEVFPGSLEHRLRLVCMMVTPVLYGFSYEKSQ